MQIKKFGTPYFYGEHTCNNCKSEVFLDIKDVELVTLSPLVSNSEVRAVFDCPVCGLPVYILDKVTIESAIPKIKTSDLLKTALYTGAAGR